MGKSTTSPTPYQSAKADLAAWLVALSQGQLALPPVLKGPVPEKGRAIPHE